MKVFSNVHDFDYSWDEVSTANWRKYCPWNKESSHVIAVDTLSRTVNPKTGILRTERLITCRQAVPKWLLPLLGGSEVSYVYEVSHVTPGRAPEKPPLASSSLANYDLPTLNASTHPKSASTTQLPQPSSICPADSTSQTLPPHPTVVMTSQNMTWSDLLRVQETVTYTPSPTSPTTKTRFEQHARITALCGGWAKLREKIEGFTVERFGQNAEKGRVGFEEVLEMSRRAFGEERRVVGDDGRAVT